MRRNILILLFGIPIALLVHRLMQKPLSEHAPPSEVVDSESDSTPSLKEEIVLPSSAEARAEALEAELKQQGMGNMRVYSLPSTEPNYYREKLNETDSILPDPAYLRASPRPVVFREFVHKYLKEPLTDSDLEFFLTKLSGTANAEIKLQCAVLLYRYGHRAGEDYLASRLSEPDGLIVATVFALNRESKYIPEILEVLSAAPAGPEVSPFDERSSKEPLLQALAGWQLPELREVLLDLNRRLPVLGVSMAHAMATSEVEGAADLIARSLARFEDDAAAPSLMAALYMLTEDDRLVEDIESELAESVRAIIESDANTSEFGLGVERCRSAAEALATLQTPSASERIQKAVAHLLEVSDIEKKGQMDYLLHSQLLALAKSDGTLTEETAALLAAVVPELRDDGNIRLKLACILSVEQIGRYPSLENVIGDEALLLARKLESLRVVPDYYLPLKSRVSTEAI